MLGAKLAVAWTLKRKSRTADSGRPSFNTIIGAALSWIGRLVGVPGV
jgi:hypothetical protein